MPVLQEAENRVISSEEEEDRLLEWFKDKVRKAVVLCVVLHTQNSSSLGDTCMLAGAPSGLHAKPSRKR